MGALADTTRLLHKYPLTFLAASAVAAVALPIFSVSTAAALRPWAKRILSNAFSVRREAQRIAAESREAYADLLAEALAPAARPPEPTATEPLARRAAPPSPRPHRAEPTSTSTSAEAHARPLA